MLHPADKAVLRLTLSLGLAASLAYGFAMPAPFLVCVMAAMVACKPGPPIPLGRGVVVSVVMALLLSAGILMVPLLEYYATAGVMLTAAMLYLVFFTGAYRANPLVTMILVIAVAVIPVVGTAEQILAPLISVTLAVGLAVGILVSGISHAFFPDAARPSPAKSIGSPRPSRQAAAWFALRATLIMMPVFVLALTNPSFYLAAVIKTITLAQQSGTTTARTAGRELVGSTAMGAWMAVLAWGGLSLWPNLWMLVLWLMAAGLWSGVRLFRLKNSSFPPSFWSNALVTMLILLGPAIEDSANGKDVYQALVVRVFLFIGVALYAWATVWVLERVRVLWPLGVRGRGGVRGLSRTG
ncbi:hypothetical protein [Variovorax sp. HJSM1_2]|uniref:hypothetical protein n=1 Tax=Variovorax sp. HJSM1_2 TaxID=3366263 RepID=UPI003BE739FE